MPAYARLKVTEVISSSNEAILGHLVTGYERDGYASQLTQQTSAWIAMIELLKEELRALLLLNPAASQWAILFEYPLYRLRKRIDVVVLTETLIIVVETKIGASSFHSTDVRQVEEYALDLRDFHAGSQHHHLVPVLWCTDAKSSELGAVAVGEKVSPVYKVGRGGLCSFLSKIRLSPEFSLLSPQDWDNAAYRPVPNVIQAATTIFAGNTVESITKADASNLREAAVRIVEILVDAKNRGQKVVVFLTGVPGSGKTLAGLQVVHDAIASGAGKQGDIVYLSGNSPLVTVLREALARDEYERSRLENARRSLKEIRPSVRARIQHINDFLMQSINAKGDQPPHEHAIIFDEAQRAWDSKQGEKKFGRAESEPSLLLELMGRHNDWCGLVCLVGGGQEINSGEKGVSGWGDALRNLDASIASKWVVFAPRDVVFGGSSTNGSAIGDVPSVTIKVEPALQLQVSMRSYRCPALSDWVQMVLEGAQIEALQTAKLMKDYPVIITRSLDAARERLRLWGRGHRRYGLVASSGARRLRADGLGVMLSAEDQDETAHWYLDPMGDIRSSFALEVPVNQFTCQGLELDFVGLCWGGDLLRDADNNRWVYSALGGSSWKAVKDAAKRQFIQNSYRVLMTRAREGLVIWVPEGSTDDQTRDPKSLDATADFLKSCGAQSF